MKTSPTEQASANSNRMAYDLGLDCGTNSLGWACVRWEPVLQISLNPECLGSGEVIAAGARVFPEATEKKTGALKNLARRQKRSMRKNLRQRRWRRDHLISLLVGWGWMPQPPAAPDAKSAFHHALSDGVDPYQLRAEGLQRKLTLAEFARVLLHMVKRRGFQSNRLAKNDKENGPVLSAIKRVAEEIGNAGSPTLGAFLHQRRQEDGALPVRNRAYLSDEVKAATGKGKKKEEGEPPADGPYALFTRRAMYDQELHLLWQAQQLNHGDALNAERLKLVQRYVLEQRPLKVQRHLVGECPHVPGQKRAPMAYLQAQEARILATLNTLRVMNPDLNARRDHASRELTQSERQKLLEKLMASKELEWDAARKVLGLHNGEKFNIEYGGRAKKLKGNTTLTTLRKALPAPKKAGKGKKEEVAIPAGPLSWDDLHDEEQHAIIKTLVYEDHEGRAAAYICQHSRLDRATAERLAEEVTLERGYFAFSAKALNAILPHLRSYVPGRVVKGKPATMLAMTLSLEAAGFSHLKQFKLVPQLPLPSDLRNPVVNKALFQVRKVVNALIRRYGLPRRIRIELARDMKRTDDEKKEYSKEIEKRDKRRAAIRPEINRLLKRSADVEPKPEEYLRFELWEECDKTCPYSLRPIGCEQVYSAEVQIEHIIPWSRCFDDSRGNKTLCYWRHNQCKGRLTPREAFAEANPAHFEQMCQHMRHCVEKGLMKRGKAGRFEWTNVEQEAGGDEFTNRHLSDTRYLSRAIHDYLKQLNPDPDTVFVQVAKGDTTAVLRHYWGLNDSAGTPAAGCILPPFTSATAEGKKNRDDHRHHAVDAIVIALTSPSILQFLSRLGGQQGRDALYDGRLHLPPPWKGFRESVRQRIAGITVSHDPTRKATGSLHDETAYGRTHQADQYVSRIRIEKVTAKHLNPAKCLIRDQTVAQILRDDLVAHGGEFKKAFQQPVFHKDGKTRIRSVRVLSNKSNVKAITREGDAEPFRFHDLGENHHAVILHNLERNRWEERIISLLEAAERSAKRLPLIQKHWGASFEIALVLQKGDMIEIDENGQRVLYCVRQVSSKDYVFRRHNIARIDGDMEEVGKVRIRSMPGLQELNPRMVDVTPLGDIVSRG